jgi:hypothetical protein
MEMMTYDEARDQIKNGDIVHVFRPKASFSIKTLVHSLIWFFTGSRIFHNVVAIWMVTPGGMSRLMAVESHIKGGKRIVPMSLYAGFELQVQPLPFGAVFSAMEEMLMERVGDQPYGLLDFVSIGAREFFGLKLKDHGGSQVCSELCAEAWMLAGVPVAETLVSPGKLYNNLLELGVPISIKINA